MTRRRRIVYPTALAVGPMRLATLRHQRGYVIVDDRTGRIAATVAHPITGRPMPALEPDARRALQVAAAILEAERTALR